MAGRKPAPAKLKVLRGDRPSRVNDKQPEIIPMFLQAPDWLSPKAKEAFNDLYPILNEMGIVGSSDKMALEMLCDAYAEYREARGYIEEEGSTYDCTTPTGTIVRVHPQVAIASDAWKRVRSMMSEFGLTPSARNKVSASGKDKEDPLEKFMNR